MMEYQKNGSTEEIMKMDMEYERKTTFTKGHLCSRKTAIFVLLGTVCIIILMIMTSVILFHQQRTFSELESLMNVHSSNQTSVKPDLQITEVQVKNIETLISNLASSLSSISSKQEENQQKMESLSSSVSEMKSSVSDLSSSVSSLSSQLSVIIQDDSQTEVKSLMNNLSSAVSALTAKLNDAVNKQDQKQTETERSLDILKSSIQTDQQNKQRDFESLSSSLSVLKSSVSDLTSSVASLSSKQQTSEERIMNALKDLRSNTSNKTADVPVTCKSGWISYKSSCFLFSSNKLNWTQARDYCKTQDALLLKIQDDDGEWAFLNHRTIPTSYWVGLTDQTTGQWRWADDTPYTMNTERWDPGQPDDWTNHGLGEEGEDCGQISYTGKLNDCHCSMKLKYICRVQILN
ncbi:asialoglycoprotein receptor 1 isoform X4 [Megalobrama amblycephala]|uniref:asialoglycoprotein receptor 1 isoform X4 n=1 Tax=Megalobrama amblycephala TaxID=75352 RepID=UPI002013CC32|nr:asialoglycoprotein receptor 1 isoform X4 [Megalobrama amblycephala]